MNLLYDVGLPSCRHYLFRNTIAPITFTEHLCQKDWICNNLNSLSDLDTLMYGLNAVKASLSSIQVKSRAKHLDPTASDNNDNPKPYVIGLAYSLS